MNGMAYTYLLYLVITIGITIWVARTLRHNGLVFLARSEADRPLADALSHLLIVGFYLVMFGVITFAMKSPGQIGNAQAGIELLSTKVGIILVSLGGMHFLILLVFSGVKQKHEERRLLAERRHSVNELADLRSRDR